MKIGPQILQLTLLSHFFYQPRNDQPEQLHGFFAIAETQAKKNAAEE
jgi:hypothetical protein